MVGALFAGAAFGLYPDPLPPNGDRSPGLAAQAAAYGLRIGLRWIRSAALGRPYGATASSMIATSVSSTSFATSFSAGVLKRSRSIVGRSVARRVTPLPAS